ncbi:MAG: hypothetical protein JWQ95_99 [Sphaerisporangium sp.]|nr:hypothetical protein [Sphaerisporangium sp.]
MAANCRLTIAAHILTWLALAHRRGTELLTSDQSSVMDDSAV